MATVLVTRFGTEVQIAARCDDYEQSGGVHIIEPGGFNPRSTFTYELRADGGLPEIERWANLAPLAGCTGKHEFPQGANAFSGKATPLKQRH